MKYFCILIISLFALYLLVWEYTSRYYEYQSPRSSPTQEISKHLNVYIGNYRPARPFLVIEDSLRIKIPDMWVEHRWKFTSSYKLKRKFILTDGYNAFFPFRQEIKMFNTNNYATNQRPPLDNNYDLPKKYFIQLYRVGKEIAEYPGIAYYVPGGHYKRRLAQLPDTLKLWLVKKGPATYSGMNIEIINVDSITYIKEFSFGSCIYRP